MGNSIQRPKLSQTQLETVFVNYPNKILVLDKSGKVIEIGDDQTKLKKKGFILNTKSFIVNVFNRSYI